MCIMHVLSASVRPCNTGSSFPKFPGWIGGCAVQDDIKDQLGNEETQAGILLNLGRASQAEEIYRYLAAQLLTAA